MKVTQRRRTRQKVFYLQPQVLASIDRQNAQRALRVFDQAWAYRLWTQIPMLPSPAPHGWRSVTETFARQELQNTYQTAALAFDLGIPRKDLAKVRDFKHFSRIAREAVRLFDIRIGPPWWVGDRDFLEMAYTAVMAQEEPADQDMVESIECYLGDIEGTLPTWVAESWLDHFHSNQADIVGQCRMHYYQQPSWDAETDTYEFGFRERLKPDKNPIEAELSMLLNWQILWQPSFATDGRDETDSFRARSAFPHRAEERRLMRILSAQPRGRPQRTVCD